MLHEQSVSNQPEWSSGMIPPLGGGGPGFKSRFGPTFTCKDEETEIAKRLLFQQHTTNILDLSS